MLFANARYRGRPLLFTLCTRMLIAGDQIMKLAVLLLQIGNRMLECVTRYLPFLLRAGCDL